MSDSLYLEESLAAIVRTTMDALGATGAALVLDDGEIAWPEGRAGAYAERLPLRWRGRQIGELVCDRDTPFTEDDRQLLVSIAHHAAVALEHGRAVMRGVLAQEIHHRVKNNLQTVASLLRLQARATDGVDPREALEHSVNRILAIAAVHEVLTERREDDVLLDELLDRLRAMLVQGIGAGKRRRVALEPVALAGARATALALVFSELLQNALEHGGEDVRIELALRNGDVLLAIADSGDGSGRRRRRNGPLDRAGARAGRAQRPFRAAARRGDAGRGRFPGVEAAICGNRVALLHNRYAYGHVGPLVQLVFFSMEAAGLGFFVAVWAASVLWTARDAQRRCGHASLRVGAPLARSCSRSPEPACTRSSGRATTGRTCAPTDAVAHPRGVVEEDDDRCAECSTPLRARVPVLSAVRRARAAAPARAAAAGANGVDGVPVVHEPVGEHDEVAAALSDVA